MAGSRNREPNSWIEASLFDLEHDFINSWPDKLRKNLFLNIHKIYPDTFTVLVRSDTSQYLIKFEFFNPDPPQWSSDPKDAMRFDRHDYAESNFRLIIERMGDPLNKTVRLKSCKVTVDGSDLVVTKSMSMCVVRVAWGCKSVLEVLPNHSKRWQRCLGSVTKVSAI